MLKTTTLIIFILVTLSGCSSVEYRAMKHPEVKSTTWPDMPTISRSLLDCNKVEHLPICKWVARRDALAKQAFDDQQALNKDHNDNLREDQ